MSCNDSKAKPVTGHEHRHVIDTELLLKILGVPRETEALSRHGFLVDGACHKYIHQAVLDIIHGTRKRSDCSPGRLGSSLPGLCEHIVGQAVQHVDTLRFCVGCRCNDIGIKLIQLRYGLLIKSEQL